jgi:hypothetical protein
LGTLRAKRSGSFPIENRCGDLHRTRAARRHGESSGDCASHRAGRNTSPVRIPLGYRRIRRRSANIARRWDAHRYPMREGYLGLAAMASRSELPARCGS